MGSDTTIKIDLFSGVTYGINYTTSKRYRNWGGINSSRVESLMGVGGAQVWKIVWGVNSGVREFLLFVLNWTEL